MLKISLVSFIFCCCIFATTHGTEKLPEITNNTLMSYLCDDELLKMMAKRLEQITLANELVQTKLDLLRVKLEQHDIGRNLQQTELKKTNTDFVGTHINENLPKDCADAVPIGGHSGIYRIQLSTLTEPMLVYCEVDPEGGDAWTIVQRRLDGSIDFYRNWADYKKGFGNIAGEYFIGLDKLHTLTSSSHHELWIQMEDFQNEKRSAKYDAFGIGNAQQAYALNVLGKFSGDGGDALRGHQGKMFSTKDVDKDDSPTSCAVEYVGAWWYGLCHTSNLNGKYLSGEYPKEKFAQGVVWQTWKGYNYSLKYVHMGIRRVK